ncbi:MAG: LemA family protein [Candidatus Methylomirabilales bacterium]
MSPGLVTAIVIGVLILGFIAYFIRIYNGLVRRRNYSKNAWSQIDVQLKRRHNLIPNLVETAKGYVKHEQETLEKVMQARSAALGARSPGAAGKAESALGAALTGFLGIVENYPDLKANENFQSLMEELTSTENKIGFARQAYNDATTQYNNYREVFPNSLISGAFEPAELFEVTDEAVRQTPKVQF